MRDTIQSIATFAILAGLWLAMYAAAPADAAATHHTEAAHAER